MVSGPISRAMRPFIQANVFHGGARELKACLAQEFPTFVLTSVRVLLEHFVELVGHALRAKVGVALQHAQLAMTRESGQVQQREGAGLRNPSGSAFERCGFPTFSMAT